MTPSSPGRDLVTGRMTAVFLAGVTIAVVICYGQLARYFFAQDDFILLQKAACDPAGAVFGFFRDSPGQFRPLTKGLYFVLAHRLFGMNAFLYHTAALAIHIVNIILVYTVLRRWKAETPAALVGAALFGLSSGFFHVLAWVACIQQLVAMMFVLLTIKWGIDAMHVDAPPVWKSAVAYVVALLSFEEAAAIPFALLVSTALLREPVETRRAFQKLWLHWVVFGAYCLFMLLWKGLPGEGVYGVHFGANIVRNLATYAAWSLHYFTVLPGLAGAGEFTFQKMHGVAIALVAYHLIRGRWQHVLLGLMFFVVMALPAAVLDKHTYFLHTYIPSLGITYLVALAAGDVLTMRPFRSTDGLRGVLGVTLVVLTAAAFHYSRANEKTVAPWSDPFRSSFVIRRALISQTMFSSIGDQKSPDADGVVLVYSRTQFARGNKESWNNDNVINAVGGAAGIRLLYGRCDLEVRFTTLGEDLALSEPHGVDVFYYDDLGNCRIKGKRQ